MSITLHQGDLPDGLTLGRRIAVDTETMGLRPHRDRLCLVQLSDGGGDCHLVQFRDGIYEAPNLQRLLGDPEVLKLFHFARFDVAVLWHYLDVVAAPLFCTKIASKLCRTFTDRHGLKDLAKELLDVELPKQQQMSDWGAETLSQEQLQYAANDVLHLHALHDRLQDILAREGRTAIAEDCFAFLPTRAALDLAGWEDADIFAH